MIKDEESIVSSSDDSSGIGGGGNAGGAGGCGSVSTDTEGDRTNSKATESSFNLARSETRAVNRSKMLVIAAIVVAAGVVGGMVFHVIDSEEQHLFVAEVRNDMWLLPSSFLRDRQSMAPAEPT